MEIAGGMFFIMIRLCKKENGIVSGKKLRTITYAKKETRGRY
jgi:hypothetical protein